MLAGLFEPAFAVTLVSAVAAAVALANLAALLRLLTGAAASVLVPTAALAFSHTFWQFATHAESYTLVAALLTAEWLCLARFAHSRRLGWLLLLALCNGLGVANHMLAALATPVDAAVIAWALLRHRRDPAEGNGAAEPRSPRSRIAAIGLAAAALWIIGASPYLGLIAAELAGGAGWAETLSSALVGKYAEQVLNAKLAAQPLLLSAAFVLYNFPGLVLPLAAYGAWRGRMPALVRGVLLVQLLVYTAFVIRYSIPDQYTFFVPVYAILAVFAGVGLDALRRLRPAPRRLLLTTAAITACWTPLLYPLTAAVLRRTGALAGMVPQRPYTDGYWLYFVPWGVNSDHVPRLHDALRALGGERLFVLLDTGMMRFSIRYDQHLGRLPAEIRLATIASLLDRTPAEIAATLREALDAGYTIVLAPDRRADPHALVPAAAWRPVGELYVLESLSDEYNERSLDRQQQNGGYPNNP